MYDFLTFITYIKLKQEKTSMKLVATDLLGLVLTYLRACGYRKAAEYLKSKANFDDDAVFFQFRMTSLG